MTRSVSAVTTAVGSFPAIIAAVILMLLWIVGAAWVKGGFTNQLYQLVVTTVSSIVTFVMVFVIQSSQNRDSRAIQAKLDAQNYMVARLAEKLGVEVEELPVRLVGVEDAPDRAIRDEQAAVRSRIVGDNRTADRR